MTAEAGPQLRHVLPEGITERSLGERLRSALATRGADAGPVLGSPGRHLDTAEFADLVGTWAATVRRLVAGAGVWEPTPDLPRRPVAVLGDADLDTIVAIAAVVTSGHPLIVLDPLVPAARRRLIVSTADAVEVTGTRLRSLAGQDTGGGPGEPPVIEPGDPAVIVFTSGSTGRPKAVVHSHAFWLNQVREGDLAFAFDTGDRVAQVLPVSYGAGLDILFMALLNGAALAYHDPRQLGLRGLIEWLTVERATTLHCTPALLRSILAELPPAGSVPGSSRGSLPLAQYRLITTCGEQVFGSDVQLMRAFAGDGTVFVNWSGSSETGNLAFFEIPPDEQVPDGPLPAGHPAAHKSVQLRAPDGGLLPAGGIGVLEVVSHFLFTGYLGEPDLTAARLTVDPDGVQVFRTGDLARLEQDGSLQLLGRGDCAVKIRGYLVEPSEVEAALRSVGSVADAAVVVTPVPAPGLSGDHVPPELRLAAYVCLDTTGPGVTVPALRTALRERLPVWMQPHTITLLPRLPRTERGKIDTAALPEPHARPTVFDPLRGPVETRLADLWAQVTQVEQVGRDQTLLELGADSLVVEAMLAAAEDLFGVDLLTSDVSEHPSLAAFATLIEQRAAGRIPVDTSGLSTLRPGPARTTGPTVFCLAGVGGHGSGFAPLAGLLARVGSVHAIQMRGLEGGRPDLTMSAMIRHAQALIEQAAPSGPLVLVGHSMGGLLATAIGSRLSAAGRQVRLVAVLDTVLPAKAVPRTGPGRTPAPGWPTGISAALRRGGGAGGTPRHHPGKATAGLGRPLWQSRVMVARAVLGHRYPIGVHKQVYFELGARIVRHHRPVPFTGRSILITSHENEDLPQWWEPILPGLQDRLTLPCDHVGVLKQPYVQQTADVINAALDG